MVLPRRSRVSSALREAQRVAKQHRLEDRARLIGAGIIAPKSNRRNKFNNVEVVRNGIQFKSLWEAEYAAKLNLLKAAGEIVDWEKAPTFVLLDAPKVRDRVLYTPDFSVTKLMPNKQVLRKYYVECKGSSVNKKTGKRSTPTATQAFSIRVRLWRATQSAALVMAYSDGVERTLVESREL